MIRISTIFVAICMVLIAASLGMALYALAGLRAPEAAIIALAAFTFLILYNAVSMRLRDRSDVGTQIADLSRGTADLARQVAEYGRRLAAMESKTASAESIVNSRVDPLAGEINELGTLMKQLAISVAAHDDALTALAEMVPAAAAPTEDAPPEIALLNQDVSIATPAPPKQRAAIEAPAGQEHDDDEARATAELGPTVTAAVEANRIDLYLQPLVSLPQRKVRYYEVVSRLRNENDKVFTAAEFIAAAEQEGLMPRIDNLVMLRCVQVLRRLLVRNKDIGLFCNIAAATLRDIVIFSQCLDFLDANRALAPSFVLEFKQSTFRNLGPLESEHLAALAQRGFRFSIDNVTDLRIEPRDLADRGVRFVKVPAALLLDQSRISTSDIHPADLSDLLGRFGIHLVAERIEGERAVVDLLDYDVRFGQGFLFAPPRPLRPEGASATGGSAPNKAQEMNGSGKTASLDGPTIDPPRATGNAALARRAAGPG